jgi:phosphatidylglycerophosphate synthase
MRSMPGSMRAIDLDGWSRANAVGLLVALLGALGLGAPWPIGVVALGSFTALIAQARGQWTSAGRFGAANAVTSARLALVIVLSVSLHHAAGALLATVVLATLLLDGVDGWLARRAATCSAFGAHFDMEVDALLVLSTSAELLLSGRFGSWILLAGVLRYAYVSCVALWPPRGGDMPRTLLGRSAFALVVSGHALGFAWAGRVGLLAAALGTAAVTLSFARSFAYGYARSPKPIAET